MSASSLAAIGVADTVHVGEQHELAGAETGRDAGRDVVGVDVADDAVGVTGQRRDDRDLATDQDRVEQVAAQADHRATSPSCGIRSAIEQAAIDAGQADGIDAEVAQAETSSLLTTPRRTAAATSSDWASVTRRPPSNLEGTPSRSSHSVMRFPPPWTRTTGRRRATAATSARTWRLVGDRRATELDDQHFAHVVYSEFSITYASVRSQPKPSPRPVPRPRSSAKTTSSACIAARAAARSNSTGPPRDPSNTR